MAISGLGNTGNIVKRICLFALLILIKRLEQPQPFPLTNSRATASEANNAIEKTDFNGHGAPTSVFAQNQRDFSQSI